LHHLPGDARVVLEAAALLHDIGHSISHKGHHKHGEYLTMNGDIAGLEGRDRALTAAVVRYHNRKAEPENHHVAYASLNNNDRRLARRLASLVRIAEGLDHSHRQRVNRIRVAFQRDAVGLQVEARGDASEDIRDANRSIELFEREFHTRLYFRPLMN
jgi:exopolyphosphatase / guanosine-5'-triphosphate,3'-diphosphate pyrophosphatase